MSRPGLDIFAVSTIICLMIRKLNFAPNEYYHVYNRGADRRKIFLDKGDHERFLTLLYLCNSGIPLHRSDLGVAMSKKIFAHPKETTLVDIGAYCLMPNHFHLLLREQSEGGISAFMQKLSTAYAMYFNRRHERRGTLFEGRFKATHVARDEYLKYLFAYIHLNPIGIIDAEWKKNHITHKKNAEEYLNSYKYSSYLDYAKKDTPRSEKSILNTLAFPEYFEKATDFKD